MDSRTSDSDLDAAAASVQARDHAPRHAPNLSGGLKTHAGRLTNQAEGHTVGAGQCELITGQASTPRAGESGPASGQGGGAALQVGGGAQERRTELGEGVRGVAIGGHSHIPGMSPLGRPTAAISESVDHGLLRAGRTAGREEEGHGGGEERQDAAHQEDIAVGLCRDLAL